MSNPTGTAPAVGSSALVRPRDAKWSRYHIEDLEVGDIATMRNIPNRAHGVLAVEGNRLTLNVTDGSKQEKWTIYPDADGWVPNICDVHRSDESSSPATVGEPKGNQ